MSLFLGNGQWEHIFIGGMEAYIYWGDGSKSLGG